MSLSSDPTRPRIGGTQHGASVLGISTASAGGDGMVSLGISIAMVLPQ